MPTRIDDECTETFDDDDDDDDDDIPDEWKDDGEIHLIKRCQRMVQVRVSLTYFKSKFYFKSKRVTK